MDNQVEELNQPVQQPTYTQPAPATPNIPEEYQPVSIGGYIGYSLLFGIPCVGLIAALIIAFGGNKRISLKNYAKSYLVLLLIGVIISVVVSLIFGVGIFSMFNSIRNY